MPRGSGTGENPATSPAAGPGWEGSFSGQRWAAAPPPLLGWRWGYSFLPPLRPVNHATVIRGLCGARANPQSHSTCSRYFNFMPLAPGGSFSRSASPGETCVPSSAASSPCPIPEAWHHGGEHPASRSKGALWSRLAQRDVTVPGHEDWRCAVSPVCAVASPWIGRRCNRAVRGHLRINGVVDNRRWAPPWWAARG